MGFDGGPALLKSMERGCGWTYDDTSYIPSEGTVNERDKRKDIQFAILCAVSHLVDLFLADSIILQTRQQRTAGN